MDWLARICGRRNTVRYTVQEWRHGRILSVDDGLTRELDQAIREHGARLVAAPVGERVAIGFDLWAVRRA